jgi:hypothetical protein
VHNFIYETMSSLWPFILDDPGRVYLSGKAIQGDISKQVDCQPKSLEWFTLSKGGKAL